MFGNAYGSAVDLNEVADGVGGFMILGEDRFIFEEGNQFVPGGLFRTLAT